MREVTIPWAFSRRIAPVRAEANAATAPCLTTERLTIASDAVTTLPLRQLLRDPARVKQLTAGGHEVHITDRGVPLWVVRADSVDGESHGDSGTRVSAWEELYGELLQEAAGSGVSAMELICDGRR